jgi:hypothetical protein
MRNTHIDLALDAVGRVPEHDLRRLAQRIAVTDPATILRGIDAMARFDQVVRLQILERFHPEEGKS